MTKSLLYCPIVLSGFEPLSRAPKARRIDHYPTGLRVQAFTYRLIHVLNFCATNLQFFSSGGVLIKSKWHILFYSGIETFKARLIFLANFFFEELIWYKFWYNYYLVTRDDWVRMMWKKFLGATCPALDLCWGSISSGHCLRVSKGIGVPGLLLNIPFS